MHNVFDPHEPAAAEITFDAFLSVDIRVGEVILADAFPEAKKPAYKLTINFGPGVGNKKSSAQITEFYRPEDLIGRQVIAVVNFPPRQIGPFISEVLILGFPSMEGKIVLAQPDKNVPNGARLV